MKPKIRAALFRLSILLMLGSAYPIAFAQIGVGTTTPHPSAMMHISAGAGNNRGLLLPSIGTGSRILLDSTQNLANGLLFFDNNLQRFYYFGKSPKAWKEIDSDWIRKDVHSASPVVGTHIYLGVPGNVGIGTLSTDDPNAKLTVSGSFILGSAAYVAANTPPTHGSNTSTAVVEGWVGVGTATRTNASERLRVVGDVSVSSDLVVNGDFTAPEFIGEGYCMPGTIMAWSGNLASSFDANGNGVGDLVGWSLCDGRLGRPDLRGRFIVGQTDGNPSGSWVNDQRNKPEYADIGNTGGRRMDTLEVDHLPPHSHTGTANSTGSSHSHAIEHPDDYEGYTASFNSSAEVFQWNDYGGRTTSFGGSHSHSLNINNTGGGDPFENRPPYYTVVFIIKKP